MKLFSTRVPSPMMAGPRMVDADDLGPLLHDDPALDAASRRRRVPSIARLDGLEDQPVALQQGLEVAGVDPPALDHLLAHTVALVDQPLDRRR